MYVMFHQFADFYTSKQCVNSYSKVLFAQKLQPSELEVTLNDRSTICPKGSEEFLLIKLGGQGTSYDFIMTNCFYTRAFAAFLRQTEIANNQKTDNKIL